MKIKIDQLMYDLGGQAFTYPKQEMDKKTKKMKTVQTQFTLKEAILVALNMDFPAEQTGAKDKFKRYKLLKRVFPAIGSVDLSRRERAFLKHLIGKSFNQPIFVGRAIEAISE